MATQTLGLSAPVGSAAMAGEVTDLDRLEDELRDARKATTEAKQTYEAAIRAEADIAIKLGHAQAQAQAETIRAAAMVDREVIDQAIADFRDRIRSGAAVVAEVGNSFGWGRGIDDALGKAAAEATADELPGVVLIRARDGSSAGRAPGVSLLLDMSMRLPQPESTLTASERSRRAGSRGR